MNKFSDSNTLRAHVAIPKIQGAKDCEREKEKRIYDLKAKRNVSLARG